MNPNDAITVVIPTSPIFCHPSTEIMDETVAQVRKHLPTAQVLILVDGVHPEEIHLTEKYEEYKKNLRVKLNEWPNIFSLTFLEWKHQSGMLRSALLGDDLVSTPLVLWMEHDLPLRNEHIDWQGIVDTLRIDEVYGIRFHFTGEGKPSEERGEFVSRVGVPLLRTVQYVNWPQVVRLDFFKEFIRSFGNAKTYLECSESDGFLRDHERIYPYATYYPEGEKSRCYHTSGRERNISHAPKPYVEFPGYKRYVDR